MATAKPKDPAMEPTKDSTPEPVKDTIGNNCGEVWTLIVDPAKSRQEAKKRLKERGPIKAVAESEDIDKYTRDRLETILWGDLELLGWKPLADHLKD